MNALENSPSNPVAPTIDLLVKRTPETASPVGNPVAPVNAWKALADVAAALLNVANAMSGESFSYSQIPAIQNSVTTVTPSLVVLPGLSQSPTIREAINELLIAKARAGRSDRYLRQLRVSLGSFAKGRGNQPMDSVSVGDVERWLFSQHWKVKTMRGYLGDVRALFNFSVRRGYCKTDPAKGVELPADTASQAPVEIHTPDQVQKVLETAREFDLDVLRHLAIRYFCGVRSAEAHRMTEENIFADRGFVEIPAMKSKTRRRRLVKIQPCLASWLSLGGTLRPIRPDTIRAAIKLSGVDWPHNVTRHSFVSYHLGKFESAAKTALEAGHSEQILFNHYREVVTREDAENFWAILPKNL